MSFILQALTAFVVLSTAFNSAAPFVDNVIPQSWSSPDNRYVLRHQLSQDLHTASDQFDSLVLSTYTLSERGGAILWTGTSSFDCSSHEFRALWSPDSASAILLDRPERGSIEVAVIRPGAPAAATVLHAQRLFDEILLAFPDPEASHLQKAWAGEWRFRDGRFEGLLFVTSVKKYHRLHVAVDPAALPAKLQLLDLQHTDEWNDALEKL